MAPASISISISRPKSAGYKPLPPYTDNDNTLSSNNLLVPGYAESDSSSSPPSPASIESFDILDSVAWRRGYTSSKSGVNKVRACDLYNPRWRKSRPLLTGMILLIMILVGCSVGGFFAVRHEKRRTIEACYDRGGGVRCNEDGAWAKCVAVNGRGYCEGIMRRTS